MICDYCMNNPKNNPYASGICYCSLPYFEREHSPWSPDTTGTAAPGTYVATTYVLRESAPADITTGTCTPNITTRVTPVTLPTELTTSTSASSTSFVTTGRNTYNTNAGTFVPAHLIWG